MTLVTNSSGKRVNQERTGKAQDATLPGLPKFRIVQDPAPRFKETDFPAAASSPVKFY
jgi:hypothetical protein